MIYCQSWVGTWSCGHVLIKHNYFVPHKPGLTNNTLRQVVRVSLGGLAVRLRFSNAYSSEPITIRSAAIAVSKNGSAIDVNTHKLLTFNGGESVTIPAKGDVYSDSTVFLLERSSLLAITICFGNIPTFLTGHAQAITSTYLTAGYHLADADLKAAKVGQSWFVIERVEVDVESPPQAQAQAQEQAQAQVRPQAAAIVTLGDSITDGYGSSVDKHNRWPDVLSARLLRNPATAHIAVLNVGISANCVLRGDTDHEHGLAKHENKENVNSSAEYDLTVRDSNGSTVILTKKGGRGPSALTRFDRDVLTQQGVRWLIILEGVNDFNGMSRQLGKRYYKYFDDRKDRIRRCEKKKKVKKACEDIEKNREEAERREEEKNMARAQAVAHGMIDAYGVMIDKAHAYGIKVIGCTIIPFGRSSFDTPFKIAGAKMVNEWMLTEGRQRFDAVVDLYGVMGMDGDPEVMPKHLHMGDYVHPNDAGYTRMGEAFDLGLFT